MARSNGKAIANRCGVNDSLALGAAGRNRSPSYHPAHQKYASMRTLGTIPSPRGPCGRGRRWRVACRLDVQSVSDIRRR